MELVSLEYNLIKFFHNNNIVCVDCVVLRITLKNLIYSWMVKHVLLLDKVGLLLFMTHCLAWYCSLYIIYMHTIRIHTIMEDITQNHDMHTYVYTIMKDITQNHDMQT